MAIADTFGDCRWNYVACNERHCDSATVFGYDRCMLWCMFVLYFCAIPCAIMQRSKLPDTRIIIGECGFLLFGAGSCNVG